MPYGLFKLKAAVASPWLGSKAWRDTSSTWLVSGEGRHTRGRLSLGAHASTTRPCSHRDTPGAIGEAYGAHAERSPRHFWALALDGSCLRGGTMEQKRAVKRTECLLHEPAL